jgi:hypothetical protein
MSVPLMMGAASRKEFADRISQEPTPLNDCERRAMEAQMYPMLPKDQPYIVLKAAERE